MNPVVSKCSLTVLLPVCAMLAACAATIPERALELPAQTLEDRRMQSRRFEGIGEAELLAACAGVLQDLGFNVDESEADLGLIVASKERPAHDRGQATIAMLLDIFVDIEIDVDKEQRIRASLVTQPVEGDTRAYLVRVTFQRIVWNTKNEISKREVLNDPELHQQFFDRLSKSVFLEAHSI